MRTRRCQRTGQNLQRKARVPPTVSLLGEGLPSDSCPCSRSYRASQSPPNAASQCFTAMLIASACLLLISRTVRKCKAADTFPSLIKSLNCAMPDAMVHQPSQAQNNHSKSREEIRCCHYLLCVTAFYIETVLHKHLGKVVQALLLKFRSASSLLET